jgi:hypothetical protein
VGIVVSRRNAWVTD